jgi:hypothetical protein
MPRRYALIGFAEALAAPEVVWSLSDAGFRVVAFCRKGRSSALHHSRKVACHEICPPEIDLRTALSDLQNLLARLAAEIGESNAILFPLDDKALWLTSRIKLDSGWLLAGPHGGNAELALNKCRQVQVARDAGFNVPETLFARRAEEILSSAIADTFPIILKASECVPTWQGRAYSCRKWICANREELSKALDEWRERNPILVQPFITGVGEGVFGLAAPDGVRAWSAHRRLRMMNPQGSGSSACISEGVPDHLRHTTEAMIAKAGWQGIFMIELLRDESGRLWFVEFNGRPWGSLALSRRQGLEYPAWQAEITIDPQSPAGTGALSGPGVVCRNVGRELMHLLFVLRGPRSKALRSWPPFWKTIGDVVLFRPTDTVYNWRRDDCGVFFADVYSTIRNNLFKSTN